MKQETPMKKQDRIHILASRFLEGETSIDEERELTELLQGNDVPEEWQGLRHLMTGLEAIALPKDDQTAAARTPTHRFDLRRWIAAAVAATTIVIGVGVWQNLSKPEEEYVAIIYGQRCTDRDIVMEEMSQGLSIVAETQQEDVDDILNAVFNNDN